MIHLLLAHPSRLVSDSLKTVLKEESDVHIAGTATTSEELFFLLPHADLVLLGVELADSDALTILDTLREEHPQVKVVIIGVNDHPDVILDYIEAGATGYILQNESVSDMVTKLKAADREEAVVSPTVAAAMMNRLSKLANMETPLAYMSERSEQMDELSNRELEVLALIHQSFTNREIADKLFIQYGTVKNHVHNILRKLDVSSRHEAAAIYEMNQPQETAVTA